MRSTYSRDCTVHFCLTHLMILLSLFVSGNCDEKQKVNVKFTKEPSVNSSIYVRDTLKLTWNFEVDPAKFLRKVSWGIMDSKGTLQKTLFVYQPQQMPPEILFNRAFEEEYGGRVRLDENTFSFELKNVSLKDRGYFGCELDVGRFLAIIRRSVYVHVVDAEILLPPRGSTTVSAVSWMDHKVKLTCKFRAESPLTTVWKLAYENGTNVPVNGIIVTEKDRSTLSIITSSNDDFGTYLCIGKTKFTTVVHKISVKRLYKPGEPYNLKYYLTKYNNKKAIKLIWEPPKNNGGTPIQQFVIFKRHRGTGGWVQVRTSRFTLVYMTISKEDEKYGFQVMVRVKNRVGLGPRSNVRTVRNLERPSITAQSSSKAHWIHPQGWLMIILCVMHCGVYCIVI